jgi:hypothetical protein
MLTLSQKMEHLAHQCQGRKKLTWKEISDMFGEKGEAFLTFLLSIPFALALPLPGLSILLGVVIFFVGLCMARHKSLWLPKTLKNRTLNGNTVAKWLRKSLKLVKWLEKFVRPRGVIYQQHPALHPVNGWFLMVGGLILFLPFPPGTNLLPGLSVFFLSLGILEEDIACVWLGYLLTSICVVTYFILPYYLIR